MRQDRQAQTGLIGGEELAAALALHPLLNTCGYGHGSWPADSPEQRTAPGLDGVRAAARWILSCTWLSRASDHSSYMLKHVMYREMGTYVTNGEFIAAALLVGCPVSRLDFYNPNVGIRLWRDGHYGYWSARELRDHLGRFS